VTNTTPLPALDVSSPPASILHLFLPPRDLRGSFLWKWAPCLSCPPLLLWGRTSHERYPFLPALSFCRSPRLADSSPMTHSFLFSIYSPPTIPTGAPFLRGFREVVHPALTCHDPQSREELGIPSFLSNLPPPVFRNDPCSELPPSWCI